MKFVHPTAEVSDKAKIGEGTKVWNNAQVREGASVGRNCSIGKGVYIDKGVKVGNNVKIGNNASIFYRCEMGDSAFIGPHVCLTNDRVPRSVTPDGRLKSERDWKAGRIVVGVGASIGAGSVVITDVTIGKWALVGAGSVVTSDVPEHGLVFGNPAELRGFVCACGEKLVEGKIGKSVEMLCKGCHRTINVNKDVYDRVIR